MVPNDRGVGEAHGEGMHSLMKTALHEQQRVPPQQVRYRGRVATLKQLPFVLQDEPVRLWVGGENGRFAENVGCEDGSEPAHPLIDEGFRILSLVSGNELQSLSDERESEVPRWQPQPPAPGGADQEEEKDGTESNTKVEIHKDRHGIFTVRNAQKAYQGNRYLSVYIYIYMIKTSNSYVNLFARNKSNMFKRNIINCTLMARR
jgi:hypothetical protein